MATKTWGDYEVYLDQVLGRGGMGAVYKGRQISLNRTVAIKVLKKDLTDTPDFVKRFQREAALLAKLVDSHVVQVFGAGESGDEHFYAMEYVEGEDLAAKLKRGHKFSPDEIVEIGIRTGKALQAAWKQKIVHRDIKPSNIIVTKEKLIKVMDFGLAKNPESDLTQTELIMGTAKYMSPEQATASQCDSRSDLYSLGAVLYELATGTPPFVGESPTSVIYQHVHKAPVPPRKLNPAIPENLESVILRLLAKQPQQRYQTPEELVADLKAIAEGVTPDEKTILFGEVAQARPALETEGRMEPEPSSRAGLYAALAGVAVVVAIGAWFVVKVVKTAPVEDRIARRDSTDGHTDTTSGDGRRETGDGGRESGNGKQTGDGDKTTRPASEARYEELVRKGDDTLSSDRTAAIQHWESARDLLPEKDARRDELTRKINRAKCDKLLEDAQKESELEKSIPLLEEASKLAGDDADRKGRATRLLRAARFRKWDKEARAKMGSDWEGAAEAFKQAAQNTDEGTAELGAKERFCRDYSDAIKAELAKKWEDALKAFQALLTTPRGYEKDLQAHIDHINDERSNAEKAELAKREAKFKEIWDQARKDFAAARWSDARDRAKEASAPEFAAFASEEFRTFAARARRAAEPPEGMRFVTGGKFRMGGARPEDGPEGDAEVAEDYYIDAREATVADYAKFLAAIEKSGHHAGCHSDEPVKSHVPDGWKDQKPGDAVVSLDWWDAWSYAAWAGKRLPNEREWERAVRFDPASGRSRVYPWGDEYRKEGGPSAFGCEGMDKRTLEWTADWFKAYPWSSQKSSDFGEKFRVLRGGYILIEDAPKELKASFRHYYEPERRAGNIGIRCVKAAN